ncbi:MAG: transposase, partial [Betaproteobacteria bacterium]|nr:transposase [Betaproteobacteria bacterium]
AVRLVFEQQKEYGSQWAAIKSIASKIGCTAETLRTWVRRAETDQGLRGGMPTPDRERLKKLERENCELKRANEILELELSPLNGHIKFCLKEKKYDTKLQACLST